MKEGTLHIEHDFGLTPEWQQGIVDGLGNKLIDNKYLIHDGRKATGFSLFLEVMPGLSVLLMDVVYHIDVAFTRRISSDPYYSIYYDLSNQHSTRIVEGDHHKIRYTTNMGMGFMDSSMQMTFIPYPGERYYSLRIFASKALIKKLVGNFRPDDLTEKIFDSAQNTLFFCTHVDSASRLLLNELKEKSFRSPSYELLLKGVSLKVLTNTLKRARVYETIIRKMSSADTEGILNTVQYLQSDLLMDFPGLAVLAEIAGMSISKYKILFSKIMRESPQRFFLNEKLLLAQVLLQGGNFSSVKDIALELGYSKPGYFAAAYKKTFGNLPGDDLLKRA